MTKRKRKVGQRIEDADEVHIIDKTFWNGDGYRLACKLGGDRWGSFFKPSRKKATCKKCVRSVEKAQKKNEARAQLLRDEERLARRRRV
jgi:hypothetical protein